MFVKNRISDIGVRVFNCKCPIFSSVNRIFLSAGISHSNPVGVLNKTSGDIIWCDSRRNNILKELSNPPFNSGKEYREWRSRLISEFLESNRKYFGNDSGELFLITNSLTSTWTCTHCSVSFSVDFDDCVEVTNELASLKVDWVDS